MRRILGGVVLAIVLALVYVQQRVVLVTEGYQVESLRRVREELLDQHQVLRYNVLTLRSPVILSHRLARGDVQLAPPQQVEILSGTGYRAGMLPVAVGIPVKAVPNVFQRAERFASRWLDNGRKAEAEPTF